MESILYNKYVRQELIVWFEDTEGKVTFSRSHAHRIAVRDKLCGSCSCSVHAVKSPSQASSWMAHRTLHSFQGYTLPYRMFLVSTNVAPWRQRHIQAKYKGSMFIVLGDHDLTRIQSLALFCKYIRWSGYTELLHKRRVGTYGTEPKTGDVKVFLVFAQMCFQNIPGRAKSHLTLLLYLELFYVHRQAYNHFLLRSIKWSTGHVSRAFIQRYESPLQAGPLSLLNKPSLAHFWDAYNQKI